MSAPEVLVYGTIALDRFLSVDAVGQPISEATWEEKPGGEALNTALALLGWGVSVALVGTALGADPEGHRLRMLLEAERAPTQWISNEEHAVTPQCDIRVYPDGERTMSGRGFADAVAPAVPRELLSFKPLVTLDPNLGSHARELALVAAAAGCAVVAMDFAHDPDVVRVAQVLQVSQESLRRWGGPLGAPEEVVMALHHQGAKRVVLTQGTQGGLVACANRVVRFTAFDRGKALDTTGAGDVFRAGICYGLVRGWGWDDTLNFARVAAACHCQGLGGFTKVPLTEIQALLAQEPHQSP